MNNETVAETKTQSPIFDTIGELCDFLSKFPADTPITEHYTGEGRIAAIPAYESGDQPVSITIFPITETWLTSNGLPLNNPHLEAL